MKFGSERVKGYVVFHFLMLVIHSVQFGQQGSQFFGKELPTLLAVCPFCGCRCDIKIGAKGSGWKELCPLLSCQFYVYIYFVSKVSQELLYLETLNLVQMTSMTSCIVEKKIGGMGPSRLELFPFVVLAIEIHIFINNFYTLCLTLIKFM